MAEGSGSSHSPPQKQVKGILKKSKREDKKAKFEGDHSGIQWDEMNILMTESPVDKDYGHMKVDEPKTPFHEMLPDEEGGEMPDRFLSPDDLAKKVKEAADSDPSSRWEPESSGDDEEEFLSEEQKQHKKEFRDWRKKHYNEFMAVKRARELMKQDEEELRQLEVEEAQHQQGHPSSSSSPPEAGDDQGEPEAMQQDGDESQT